MTKPWMILIDDTREGEEAGFLYKLQRHRHMDADIIAYFHSDFSTLEHGWDTRVLDVFSDPSVVVAGAVGATRLGHRDIYRVPYDFRQLARADVWSNLTDAESHGGRDAGVRQVAVVDSCCVFVRRSFLDRIGGWPVATYPNVSHCTDLWICCMAHRYRQRVMLVGFGSHHSSGGRGAAGEDWLNVRGGDSALHRQAHWQLYDDMRDVLPVVIT